MPNLKPPVTTTAAAMAYRESIFKALPPSSIFTPLMTIYLIDRTSPEEILRLPSEALISKLVEVKINAFQHKSPLRQELQAFKNKDANSTSTTRQEDLKIPLLSKYVDKPISQKIQAFEAALEDANTKFLALEAALKDTKLVLKGLGNYIEDFSS